MKVFLAGVAGRGQHAVQTLARLLDLSSYLLKPNDSIDEIAQDRLVAVSPPR